MFQKRAPRVNIASLTAGALAEQPPAPEPGFLAQTRRNLKRLHMDECKMALYKATTDDPLPPKEKHVLTFVRLAGEEETAAQVDAELTKKLPLVGLGDGRSQGAARAPPRRECRARRVALPIGA